MAASPRSPPPSAAHPVEYSLEQTPNQVEHSIRLHPRHRRPPPSTQLTYPQAGLAKAIDGGRHFVARPEPLRRNHTAREHDVADFVAEMRALNATPNIAQNTTKRRLAIDRRTTTRYSGYG